MPKWGYPIDIPGISQRQGANHFRLVFSAYVEFFLLKDLWMCSRHFKTTLLLVKCPEDDTKHMEAAGTCVRVVSKMFFVQLNDLESWSSW